MIRSVAGDHSNALHSLWRGSGSLDESEVGATAHKPLSYARADITRSADHQNSHRIPFTSMAGNNG
jgi:hypothetical protein